MSWQAGSQVRLLTHSPGLCPAHSLRGRGRRRRRGWRPGSCPLPSMVHTPWGSSQAALHRPLGWRQGSNSRSSWVSYTVVEALAIGARILFFPGPLPAIGGPKHFHPSPAALWAIKLRSFPALSTREDPFNWRFPGTDREIPI